MLLWALLCASMILAIPKIHARAEASHVRPEIAVGLVFAFVGLMSLIAPRKFEWVRWRGLTGLGALTYPLYLMHLEIGYIAVKQLHDVIAPWVLLPGIMGGVLALAYATNRLLERPASAWLRRRITDAFARVRRADAGAAAKHGDSVRTS